MPPINGANVPYSSNLDKFKELLNYNFQTGTFTTAAEKTRGDIALANGELVNSGRKKLQGSVPMDATQIEKTKKMLTDAFRGEGAGDEFMTELGRRLEETKGEPLSRRLVKDLISQFETDKTRLIKEQTREAVKEMIRAEGDASLSCCSNVKIEDDLLGGNPEVEKFIDTISGMLAKGITHVENGKVQTRQYGEIIHKEISDFIYGSLSAQNRERAEELADGLCGKFGIVSHWDEFEIIDKSAENVITDKDGAKFKIHSSKLTFEFSDTLRMAEKLGTDLGGHKGIGDAGLLEIADAVIAKAKGAQDPQDAAARILKNVTDLLKTDFGGATADEIKNVAIGMIEQGAETTRPAQIALKFLASLKQANGGKLPKSPVEMSKLLADKLDSLVETLAEEVFKVECGGDVKEEKDVKAFDDFSDHVLRRGIRILGKALTTNAPVPKDAEELKKLYDENEEAKNSVSNFANRKVKSDVIEKELDDGSVSTIALLDEGSVRDHVRYTSQYNAFEFIEEFIDDLGSSIGRCFAD